MTEEKKKELKEDEVLIGSKPFLNYIRSIELLLKKRNLKQVFLKARGKKNMGLAIDLAEASKNKFFKDLNLEVADIKTDTETFEKEGKELSVSTIEIILKRK